MQNETPLNLDKTILGDKIQKMKQRFEERELRKHLKSVLSKRNMLTETKVVI